MTALYNELEPYPAQWLRNLIAAGHIAAGTVDDRSIVELQPEDVRGATQAHFFAGIGVWSAALRLAGWPDDRPVWTGSCPCQPFSASGQGRGFADDRHLWPEWFRLIRECRPAVVLGEQVASPAGLEWLDAVFADLEGAGYACAAADLCAAGVGAPHIRQRLYFVAYADVQPGHVHAPQRQPGRGVLDIAGRGAAGELANVSEVGRRQRHKDGSRRRTGTGATEQRPRSSDDGKPSELAHVRGSGLEVRREQQTRRELEATERGGEVGFWSDAEWIPCRDGKSRPVEPGPQQMADGFAESLGRVRPESIAKIQEDVTRAGISEADARQAMRGLWRGLAEETIQRPPGRCRSIYEAPVLLAFLRELAREGWRFLDDIPSACREDAQGGLRELRQVTSSTPRSSCGRDHLEQRAVESAHALSILSQAISSAIERCWMIPHPLAHGAAARVGRLRAYGNAIVRQQAAAFIGAVMDTIDEVMR